MSILFHGNIDRSHHSDLLETLRRRGEVVYQGCASPAATATRAIQCAPPRDTTAQLPMARVRSELRTARECASLVTTP